MFKGIRDLSHNQIKQITSLKQKLFNDFSSLEDLDVE